MGRCEKCGKSLAKSGAEETAEQKIVRLYKALRTEATTSVVVIALLRTLCDEVLRLSEELRVLQ